MHLPQEFTTHRAIDVIQHFGQSLIENIPAGEVILVERSSRYGRMFEAIWKDKRYLIFARDLQERTEPNNKPSDEDPLDRIFA